MRLGEVKNKKQLLSEIGGIAQRRLDARRPYDAIWWNNIALVAGDHYTYWSPTRGEYVEIPKADWRVRLVVNHALTVVRTELAKITKSRPVMELVPESGETTDLSAAKVGKKFLEGMEWRHSLRRQRKDAAYWALITGLGATYVGWDPEDDNHGKIDYLIDPRTNDPVVHKAAQAELKRLAGEGIIDEPQEATEPLGDVCYETFSPFQLLPDETALSWSKIRNLITVEVMDVDVVQDRWRPKVDISPEKGALGTIEQQMVTRASLMGLTSPSSPEPENAVKVFTLWLLPETYSRAFLRNGLMLRWCNGDVELEFSEVYPYIDGRIPFTFFEHIPRTNSIWPDCIVNHIRGPNLELDKTVSQLIENKDYMTNPMWRVATQHNIQGGVENVPGAMVKYTHLPNVPPPEPIPGTPMPQQVENLVAALRDEILDISGQGETSRGRVPSGVRSGVAVAYLQEEDETRLGPTVENFEDYVATEASLTLSRASQFYSVERLISLYQRDGEFDVFKFKGADLKGNTAVIVLAGSALPKSKAARAQNVMDLAQMGILQDPKQIRDMLELGQGEGDDIDKAFAQASRENHAMVQGVLTGRMPAYYESSGQPDQPAPEAPNQDPGALEAGLTGAPPESSPGGYAPGLQGATGAMGGMGPAPPGVSEQPAIQAPSDDTQRGPVAIPVKEWHNHEAHIKKHTSFMMDEDFEHLAGTHPEIVRLFDEHLSMHQQALEAARQQQLQALMAARGAPEMNGQGAITPKPEGQPDVLRKGEAELRQEATQ